MAARRHWRFVVRDRYGFTIQNARVYVYQPGTTNAFVGTAYNAATGGAAVTNPFITNAQGEVEAWFDTEQTVDVLTDSNLGTAYRTVDGSGVPITFTTFTEADDIYLAAGDVLRDDLNGLVGDVTALPVNPYTGATAAAGASGRWADAAHRHGYTALTPGTPVAFRTVSGAGAGTSPARDDHFHPSYPGPTLPTRTSQLALTNTTTETVIATLTVPAGTSGAGSAFDIKVPMYVTNTAAGTVTLTFRVRWGGVAGVQVGGSLAITIRASLGSDVSGLLEGLLTIRTLGATGTAVADISLFDKLTAATLALSSAAITAAATIDTTIDKDLVITAAWTAAATTSNLKVDNAYIQQVA